MLMIMIVMMVSMKMMITLFNVGVLSSWHTVKAEKGMGRDTQAWHWEEERDKEEG